MARGYCFSSHAGVCLGVEETLASRDLRKRRRVTRGRRPACRPDAIASHAEPAEVKADPREEVEVGQGGQP